MARHADWWNLPVHQLDRLEELRERAGDARVSVQVMVAVLADEADRDEVTATVRRRFGTEGLGSRVVIGTVGELVDHFAGLHERGVDRCYAWFADFAPPATVERFGEVISA